MLWYATGFYTRPYTFFIFINDLPLHFEFCLSDFYADDATVHINDKKLDTVECKLHGELGNAKHWSKQKTKQASAQL